MTCIWLMLIQLQTCTRTFQPRHRRLVLKIRRKYYQRPFFFSNTDNLSLLIQPPQPAEDSFNDKTFSHIRCYILLISCTLIQKNELSVFIYQQSLKVSDHLRVLYFLGVKSNKLSVQSTTQPVFFGYSFVVTFLRFLWPTFDVLFFGRAFVKYLFNLPKLRCSSI